MLAPLQIYCRFEKTFPSIWWSWKYDPKLLLAISHIINSWKVFLLSYWDRPVRIINVSHSIGNCNIGQNFFPVRPRMVIFQHKSSTSFGKFYARRKRWLTGERRLAASARDYDVSAEQEMPFSTKSPAHASSNGKTSSCIMNLPLAVVAFPLHSSYLRVSKASVIRLVDLLSMLGIYSITWNAISSFCIYRIITAWEMKNIK